MNHPTEEEWMAFLYHEGPAQKRHECRIHLASCSACQQTVNRWREVMGSLTAWRIADQPKTQRNPWSWAQWAAAAMIAVGLGFLAGMQRGRIR